MNIEEVRFYALSLTGVTEDIPYGPDCLVFRIGGKIFLHMHLTAAEPSVAVKLPPEEAEQLRERYEAIRPGYHLNKKHWSDLYIEALDSSLTKELIKCSYLLVRSKLPKKLSEKLKE